MKLKRDLTLADLVFYGVGIILGAGIYVLIGHSAGIAGNGVWMSFIIAAVVASFTGLSYAELSSMYPKDAAEFTYVKTAFKDTTAGFIMGWLTFFTTVIACAVVALGFGNYFSSLTGLGVVASAAMIIIVFSIINYIGIKVSARLNIILTSITLLGMLIVILIGIPHLGTIDYFETPTGIVGIIGAATLVFFAYLGFDEIVNVSEEVKNARKIVPRAIIISIIITTAIYILVAISAVSVVPWQQLGESSTPLALVAATGLGPSAEYILSVFALFATASTILIFIVAGSRMLYGMAAAKVLPKVLIRLHRKRNTPYISIIVIAAVALTFVVMGDLKDIAFLVDFSAFLIFAMMNLSCFVLRLTQPKTERLFKVPGNIGKIPVLPLVGFLVSTYMLLQFEIQTAWYAVLVIVVGYIFAKYMESENNPKF